MPITARNFACRRVIVSGLIPRLVDSKSRSAPVDGDACGIADLDSDAAQPGPVGADIGFSD
jgi:hypothetical protein